MIYRSVRRSCLSEIWVNWATNRPPPPPSPNTVDSTINLSSAPFLIFLEKLRSRCWFPLEAWKRNGCPIICFRAPEHFPHILCRRSIIRGKKDLGDISVNWPVLENFPKKRWKANWRQNYAIFLKWLHLKFILVNICDSSKFFMATWIVLLNHSDFLHFLC